VYNDKQGRRKYSKQDSEFMEVMRRKLERFNFVYENTEAVVASPAYPVKKAGADPSAPPESQRRLTVDLRAVNAHTVPISFPLPCFETFADAVAGSKFFGKLDLFNGYWQLPLHEDCQHFFTIQTDRGTYTPTRLIQGSRNAAGPFQAVVTGVLRDLVMKNCIVYIDDILIFAKTEQEFVEVWLEILRKLHAVNLKINAKKTELFRREIKFCGRVFSASGVSYDTEFIRSISNMSPPRTAAELRSYLASANWIRSAICNYAALTEKLQELVTEAQKTAGGSTKQVLQRITLSDIGWSEAHDMAFKRLNEAIANATTLAYPDSTMITCVTTDASDKSWAGIVTQVAPEEVDLPLPAQNHHPLAFVSGHFKDSELNWTTGEKEGFAVKETCVKASHLLQGAEPFIIHTDNLNLSYLFSSDVSVSDAKKQAAARIERWRITMQNYQYRIKHVAGEDNVAADMLSRWAAEPASGEEAGVSESAKSVMTVGEDALFGPINTPTDAELREAQKKYISDTVREEWDLSKDDDEMWRTDDGHLFVPDVQHLHQ
jgi:hypothetical protein